MVKPFTISFLLLTLLLSFSSCKKKTQEQEAPNASLPNPWLNNNGWEILKTRSAPYKAGQHVALNFAETHGNVADLFLDNYWIGPGTVVSQEYRWQIDLNNKQEVNFKQIKYVFTLGRPQNLAFKSLSLAEGDFMHIRSDGLYKNGSLSEPFQTHIYSLSNTNQYPVLSGFFDDKPILVSLTMAHLSGTKNRFLMNSIIPNYYYTKRLGTILHNGKLLYILIDNLVNTPIRIYESTDSLKFNKTGSNLDTAYMFKEVAKDISLLGTLDFKNLGSTVIKSGAFYHFYLSVSFNSGTSALYHLKFNPETLTFTQEPGIYPDYGKDAMEIQWLNDRPGHFIDKYTNPVYYDGQTKENIILPEIKQGAQITKVQYSNGKLYVLILYQGNIYMCVKSI